MSIIQHIVKRDGRQVSFDSERIFSAIEKAFLSQNISEPSTVHRLTMQVVQKAATTNKDQTQTDVETIQDIVEDTLINNGFNKIAKSYILYREHQKQVRQQENLAKMEKGELRISWAQ